MSTRSFLENVMKARVLFALLSLVSASALAETSGFVAAGVDAPSHFINEDVILTVTGMGTCKNFVVEWNDGSKDTIANHVFGNVVGQNNLVLKHKYTSPKTYYPAVKEVFGPSLAERCGSRSATIEIKDKATPAGFIAMTSDKPSYMVGEDVKVTVTGMGICKHFEVKWGDGPAQVIQQFDFGNNQNKLELTHKYNQAQKFYPTVSEIFGPSLNERCGSRSITVAVEAAKTVDNPRIDPPAAPGRVPPGTPNTAPVNPAANPGANKGVIIIGK